MPTSRPAGPIERGNPSRATGVAGSTVMPDRGPEAHHLLRQRPGVRDAERVEHPLRQRGVPGGAGDALDDAAGNDETGVAVRRRLADRVDEVQFDALCHVLLQAVVAATGITEEVGVDPAGVREQMPDRDRVGGAGRRELELRQDLPYRVSRLSRPAWISRIRIVAVYGLVIDPIWNTESGSASTPVPTLTTPLATAWTSPPVSTASDAPGTEC